MMHDEAVVAAVMLLLVYVVHTMKPLLDGGGHARKIGCLSIICVQIL